MNFFRILFIEMQNFVFHSQKILDKNFLPLALK